jgi:hypothetical protein
MRMHNVTNANVPNKCLNVHNIACIFAWYMFEWPYTIYGERWPIRIFYIFILFNFYFGRFWPHLIMRMPSRVVTLVAEKHGDASRDLVADLAGLIHIPFSQLRILPEVDVGVMARSAILDVLFDGLLVSTL